MGFGHSSGDVCQGPVVSHAMHFPSPNRTPPTDGTSRISARGEPHNSQTHLAGAGDSVYRYTSSTAPHQSSTSAALI